VAFALWFPVALGLEDALGLDGHPAVTAAVAFSGASALPALTGDWPRRRWLPAMGFAGAAACLWLAALWAPPFSTARPQRQSIVHLEHGDRADWYVDASWGAAPPPLAEQAGLGEVAGSPMPWLGRARAQRGEAPRSSAPAPELRLLEGGDGRQRWHVRSRRGATMLALLLPPALRAARLVREGHTLVTVPAGAHERWVGHRIVALPGVPPDGVELELHVRGAEAAATRLTVLDVTLGLPASAAPLLRARGALGVPSQDGDLSIVARDVELRPSGSR
jgi:hypothetical protein